MRYIIILYTINRNITYYILIHNIIRILSFFVTFYFIFLLEKQLIM